MLLRPTASKSLLEGRSRARRFRPRLLGPRSGRAGRGLLHDGGNDRYLMAQSVDARFGAMDAPQTDQYSTMFDTVLCAELPLTTSSPKMNKPSPRLL
jgi:hypothetical protein